MSSEPLSVQYEPEKLAHPPLKLAVAQIQYPTIMSVPTSDKLLASFQESVRDLYPLLSVGQGIGFAVSSQSIEQQPRPRIFQLTDADQRWTVTLSADSIALEARDYTTFNEFSNRLLKVIAAAKEVYPLTSRRRLGLRYVNEIRDESEETTEASEVSWNSVIRPEILGILATDLGASVNQAFQEVSLTIKNGALTMRHGAFAEGTAVRPLDNQPVLDKPFYLLDFDAFDDQPGDLSSNRVSDTLRDYNRSIFSLFRWSLTHEFYERLKGKG
jgi:uncharacterized protein (TIGR04255 family)